MFGVAELGCRLGHHASTRTTKPYDRTCSVQPASRLPSRLTGRLVAGIALGSKQRASDCPKPNFRGFEKSVL
jgi:hypothetical protein